MSNRKILLLLALIVTAGACTKHEAAPSATPASEPAPAMQADAALAASCPGGGYLATPASVDLQGDYYVRNDRVYETKNGVERRHTTLELMTGDAVKIANDIVQKYVADGFRQITVKDRGDGVTRLAIRKPGVGRVNISAAADRGKNPSNPRSIGVISFDWADGKSSVPDPDAAPDSAPDAG